MFDSALFIATGAACYGGAHQLYLGTRHAGGYPHVLHAVMFFLLAGFALATALTGNAQSVAELSRVGKLSVTFGLLLVATLPWLIVLSTAYKQRLVPALLTAVSCALLLLNIASPYSLLYQDVAALGQQLPSGNTFFSLHTSANPWWHLVELNILATLVFSLQLSFRHYQHQERHAAIKLASGLLVLLFTVTSDILVTADIIDFAYLTPMGFLAFLLASSMNHQQEAVEKTAAEPFRPQASNSYRLTVNLNQTPPAQAQGSNVEAPVNEKNVVTIEQPPSAELAHQQSEMPFDFFVTDKLQPEPEPVTIGTDASEQAETVPEMPEAMPARPQSAMQQPSARIDHTIVEEVSDSLVDIAVQASMILNRLKRGHLDPQELEALSQKVRTRAIQTRRMTHRMLRSETLPPSDDENPEQN